MTSHPTHRWTRLTTAKWEDAWAERLRFLGPQSVAFLTWPDSRAMKIEAYCDEATARNLERVFGGRRTRLAAHVWSGNPSAPRGPISIRKRLKVFSDEASWRQWGKRAPRGIYIPAGMAFGTGEHSTTASCLRMLCDFHPEPGFAAADLGCGSGILAIAAEALGAGSVDALDNDPAAIRITRQNARRNRCQNIRVLCGSVLEWPSANLRKPAAHAQYQIITANLFSELLVAAAPRLAAALRPGGILIFSGVLVRQIAEVRAALEARGLASVRLVRRGKWCAGIQIARPEGTS